MQKSSTIECLATRKKVFQKVLMKTRSLSLIIVVGMPCKQKTWSIKGLAMSLVEYG